MKLFILVLPLLTVVFSSATTELNVTTEAENEVSLELMAVTFTTIEQALYSYQTATLQGKTVQAGQAANFISKHFEEALKSPFICSLTKEVFKSLIVKPWIVNEGDIFRAVVHWLAANPDDADRSTWQELASQINLVGLSIDQLTTDVFKSRLVDKLDLLNALVMKLTNDEDLIHTLRYKNQLATENVVTSLMGAEMRNAVCTTGFVLGVEKLNETCSANGLLTITLGATFLIDTMDISKPQNADSFDVFTASHDGPWTYLNFLFYQKETFRFTQRNVRYIQFRRRDPLSSISFSSISATYVGRFCKAP